MAAVGNGSSSTSSGFVRGGGGTFAFFAWSTLYASRIATPRSDAPTSAPSTISFSPSGRWKS